MKTNIRVIDRSLRLIIGLLLLASQLALCAQSSSSIPQPASSSVTLTSASYTGTLREKSAEFTATLVLSSTGTNQTFTLFGGDVAIQSFTAKTGEARLVREGATARVWLPKAGAVTVEGVSLLTHATPRIPRDELVAPVRVAGLELAVIGDCQAPRSLLVATGEGYRAGMRW